MNLLARILSHGFAVAIVAFLIIGFMYRGELFPESELPEFLGLNKHQEATGIPAPADDRKDAPGTPDVVSSADRAPGSVSDAMEEGDAEPGRPGEVAAESALPRAPVGTTDERIGPVTETAESTAESVDTARTAAEAQTTRTPVGRATTTAPVTPASPWAQPSGMAAETEESGVSPGAAGMTADPARSGSTTDRQGDASAPGPAGMVTAPAMDDFRSTARPSVSPAAREPAVKTAGLQAPAGTTGAVAAASPYQLLAAARESFWLRDYSGAESQYRQLIETEPDNPDGYGELGNMYFSQGKWDDAAAVYYEAGARLVTAGKLPQASELAEVIRGLDGARADDLEQLISSAEAVPQ